jgi:hypothetical protein
MTRVGFQIQVGAAGGADQEPEGRGLHEGIPFFSTSSVAIVKASPPSVFAMRSGASKPQVLAHIGHPRFRLPKQPNRDNRREPEIAIGGSLISSPGG